VADYEDGLVTFSQRVSNPQGASTQSLITAGRGHRQWCRQCSKPVGSTFTAAGDWDASRGEFGDFRDETCSSSKGLPNPAIFVAVSRYGISISRFPKPTPRLAAVENRQTPMRFRLFRETEPVRRVSGSGPQRVRSRITSLAIESGWPTAGLIGQRQPAVTPSGGASFLQSDRRTSSERTADFVK